MHDKHSHQGSVGKAEAPQGPAYFPTSEKTNHSEEEGRDSWGGLQQAGQVQALAPAVQLRKHHQVDKVTNQKGPRFAT